MTDETGDIPGGEAVSYPVDSSEPLTVEDAARELTQAREKAFNPDKPIKPPAESAKPATADPELPNEGNAAADEDQPTGETEEADPDENPPLELPRSWTKEQADHWKALPRATQEYLAAQDSKASAEVRRVQNEAAEARKTADAVREQAEQARKNYEAQLPALMQELQNAQQQSFNDIRTVDDVTRLANEDPFRYLQWQAHQTKVQAVKAEVDRAEGEKSRAQQTEWTDHVQKENARAAELIPDLADKDKGPALQKRAAERLSELGFSNSELNDLASGKAKLSVYDHRIQQLIFSDLKLSDIQRAKTVATAKPVPPVQRPGTSKPAGSGVASQIQALEKQLSTASGDRAARISADIWQLERKAASR